MEYEQLKLENQLCFRFYAVSRLITKSYQKYLDELNITYPQYLTLMVLWENGHMPVNDIAKRLLLNTNTITPLLKRMEADGLVIRDRDKNDERKVNVRLTRKGQVMQEKAAEIPEQLASVILGGRLDVEELSKMKSDLDSVIKILSQEQILQDMKSSKTK